MSDVHKDWVISRNVNHISVNPVEYVLDAPEEKGGEIVKFSSPEEAVEFLDNNNVPREEIGWSIFVGHEEDGSGEGMENIDKVTYDEYSAKLFKDGEPLKV